MNKHDDEDDGDDYDDDHSTPYSSVVFTQATRLLPSYLDGIRNRVSLIIIVIIHDNLYSAVYILRCFN